MNTKVLESTRSIHQHILSSKLGGEVKSIIKLALPVAGAQLANMSMFFTDVMMAGHLSARDLAAIAVGSSVAMPVYLFAMGIVMVINPIVGHLHGSGRTHEAGSKLGQALWLAVAMAIPAAILISHGEWAMVYMGIEEDVRTLASQYLKAISLGWPMAFCFLTFRFFNDGLGKVRGYTLVLIASVPLNACLNLVFMYGYLGFPAMGARGTGYASAVVMTCTCIALGWWTYKYSGLKLQFLIKPKLATFKEMLTLGIPNGVSMCLEVSMFALMTMLIGSLGMTAVGAHQIAMNIASFTYMIPLGISLAVGIRTGHAAGRKDQQGLRLTGNAGVLLVCFTQIILAFGMITGADFWVALYTSDQEVAAQATHLLLFAALFQLGDGLQVLGLSALRGLKDTRIPMLVSVFCYWCVGMPLGWYLGMVKGMGSSGFWIAMVASLSTSAIFMNLRFFHLSKAQ